MNEPNGVAADAATVLFNLPDYHVISTPITAGRRQVIIETDQPPGCPSCGVIASRRKERRLQRLRDIPVAGPVDVLWSKYRWYCEESACDRLSFFESTPQVPCRARSTSRLRAQLVDADDFHFRFALGGASSSVVSGCLVIAQPHDDDVVERRIRLAMTGSVR
jgi:transposase